jgi:hypothetical protein
VQLFSFIKGRNADKRSIKIPKTPLTAAYSDAFKHRVMFYRSQVIARGDFDQNTPLSELLSATMVLSMHQSAWASALKETIPEFRGRNRHRKRSQMHFSLSNPEFEWLQLAYAAQLTGRSQLSLWNQMCTEASETRQSPLARIAFRVKELGVDNPPFACLV